MTPVRDDHAGVWLPLTSEVTLKSTPAHLHANQLPISLVSGQVFQYFVTLDPVEALLSLQA
jgi:hypothetical protein